MAKTNIPIQIFHLLMVTLLKIDLPNRYKTATQIEFTGTISKLQLPSKAEVRLANDIETLQAVQYFAELIRNGTANSQQLNTYIIDSGENIKNSIFVKPIIENGEITEYAFAIASCNLLMKRCSF